MGVAGGSWSEVWARRPQVVSDLVTVDKWPGHQQGVRAEGCPTPLRGAAVHLGAVSVSSGASQPCPRERSDWASSTACAEGSSPVKRAGTGLPRRAAQGNGAAHTEHLGGAQGGLA